MKDKIQSLIESIVPNAFIIVEERIDFLGDSSLKIVIAGSDKLINNVSGQYPGAISLRLALDSLELQVQHYGGSGGQNLFINTDPNNPDEKYLAYASIRIPFRKPIKKEDNVLKAIESFVTKWKEAIRENLTRMPHKDLADWNKVIE